MMRVHPQSALISTRLRGCMELAGPWRGTMFRVTTVRYANQRDLLTGAGARQHGGRWNGPGRFSCVYGSLDAHAALLESLAGFARYEIAPELFPPRVLVAVAIRAAWLLDLSSARVRSRLKLTRRELVECEWERA